MANVQRVLQHYKSPRAYPVLAAAQAIEVGDLTYWDEGNQSLRPASATSNSGTTGQTDFALIFAGVSQARHDLNSFAKELHTVCVEGEAEYPISNGTGTNAGANTNVGPGTRVSVARDSSGNLVDQMVEVDGLHQVNHSGGSEIGRVSKRVKTGDTHVRVHIQGVQVFDI